jgi:hypothetical protein
LTGDNPQSAEVAAQALGITEVYAEVLPDEKLDIVQELQWQGHVVAMVGDGMNDSAALAHANVGVSVKHGADVAREACDLLLLEEPMKALPMAVRVAQAAMSRVRTNFMLTVGANAALTARGVFGLAPAGMLALLHNTSTLGAAMLALQPYVPNRRAAEVIEIQASTPSDLGFSGGRRIRREASTGTRVNAKTRAGQRKDGRNRSDNRADGSARAGHRYISDMDCVFVSVESTWPRTWVSASNSRPPHCLAPILPCDCVGGLSASPTRRAPRRQ